MENGVDIKNNKIKIVFMGTPDFAKISLEKLYNEGFDIKAVYTNKDKPAGRGMKLKMPPVKEFAISKGLEVYQPEKIKKNEEVIEKLKEISPDVIAVVAYGKILPQEILEIPKYGCINVHASLLPKYRGAAPMQWAIINGEEKTGVTTMLMDVGMDTGDILLKKDMLIDENDNLESVHDKLATIGADLLVDTIKKVVTQNILPEKQGEDFTYAPMIKRDITKIDFNKNARSIYNFVRGLSPFPGTYIEDKLDKEKVYKIYEVKGVESDEFKGISNGKIVKKSKDCLWIKCSDGYIKILKIQPQNSKRMDIAAFLAGNKIDENLEF